MVTPKFGVCTLKKKILSTIWRVSLSMRWISCNFKNSVCKEQIIKERKKKEEEKNGIWS